MTEAKICAVSVDLDAIDAYYQIHGLGPVPASARKTILNRVLPRILDFFGELKVKSTLFVVGKDLVDADQDSIAALQRAVDEGHEIANHTFGHRYDFCRLNEREIDREIEDQEEIVVRLLGEAQRPRGFRSPGYFVNSKVINVLVNRGYAYDSSFFPSYPYYFAKAAVMSFMALRGESSGAVMADPRGLLSPTVPYHPDLKRPWRRGKAPLIEFPVATLPLARLPVIGTSMIVYPTLLRQWASSAVEQFSFFNFELHGIDFADAVVDRLPKELVDRQPDLRFSFAEKSVRIKQFLAGVSGTFGFKTLRDAAAQIS